MVRLRTERKSRKALGLGLIVPEKSLGNWKQVSWNRSMAAGLSTAAANLGYQLELVSDVRIGKSAAAFRRLVHQHNLRGFIYDGATDRALMELDWLGEFPSVVISTNPWVEPFPAVCMDFAYNMRLVLNTLHSRGYRRPGLALISSHQRFSEHLLQSQFQWWIRRELEEKDCIPDLEYEWQGELGEKSLVHGWCMRYRPDVIIGTDNRLRGWLKDWGLQVPQEIGLVHLNHADDVHCWAGVDQRRELMGRQAVELLSNLLDRGNTGSALPGTLMIRGRWLDGETLTRKPG